MKKLLSKMSELAGKTIDVVYQHNDELWMSFTDGTAAIIEPEYGYYGDRADLELTDEIEEYNYLCDAAKAIGLLTTQEVAAHLERKQEEHKRAAAYKEQQERSDYERLKRKFGST